jgi:hypothetical protein
LSEIRLLVASLPSMLREIVRSAIEAQPDMAILYEAGTLEEMARAPRTYDVDVIVVAAEQARLPKECARMMYLRPHPRTLSISPDGTATAMWRLLPQGVRMENVSPDGLVGAIRDLGRPLPNTEE